MKKLTTPVKLLILAALITMLVTTSTALQDLVSTKPTSIDHYKALTDAVMFNVIKLFMLILATIMVVSNIYKYWSKYLRDRNSVDLDAPITRTPITTPKAGDNVFPRQAIEAQLAVLRSRDTIAAVAVEDHLGPGVYSMSIEEAKVLQTKAPTVIYHALLHKLLAIYESADYKDLPVRVYVDRIHKELVEIGR